MLLIVPVEIKKKLIFWKFTYLTESRFGLYSPLSPTNLTYLNIYLFHKTLFNLKHLKQSFVFKYGILANIHPSFIFHLSDSIDSAKKNAFQA